MAHLSLQIGAAIVVPIRNAHRHWQQQAWRCRALQEVVKIGAPAASWPAAHLRARRAHGFKLRGSARVQPLAEGL